MLGSFPRFAAAKFRYFLTGAPETDGIYRRDSFNAAGDLASPLCKANIMPEGYDPTMPIRFDTALPEAAFCAALNDYTARAADAGAAVYYHFPPMNALAVANEDQLNAYTAHLQQVITAPLAGDPRTCVMESGWFYDTNFHLNAAGRTVFTKQLIRDIKAMLGDTTATEIALPAMPEPVASTAAGSGSSADAAYFTMAEDGSVTVNAAGRARRRLTVPAEINGRAVTRLCTGTFRGCTALEEVTIQSAVSALPDGLFADCPALHTIILTQPDPARLQVGQDLLADAPAACRIQLPDGSYTAYCLQYSWSAYADRFCT